MTKRRSLKREGKRDISEKFQKELVIPTFQPKNHNQREYLRSLIENQVTVVTGPPGCGKTICASYRASIDYLQGRVDNIIIARPYKHMGNYVGHLPGNLEDKLTPLLRPLIDNLKKFVGVNRYISDLGKNIEIEAVENLRGRSFDEKCWVIITESQNTTPDQMKSIITRLGESASCCIEGDPRQTDIVGENGLIWLERIINKYNITGANVINFLPQDIVRSGLVKEIILALEEENGK